MPFREIYMTAFRNDTEYSQLVLQTANILQSYKFMQVLQREHFVFISECCFKFELELTVCFSVCCAASPGPEE